MATPEVNIGILPTKITKPPRTDLVLGDLHGNPMLMLFPLIKEGAITGISKEDYQKLWAFYEALGDDKLYDIAPPITDAQKEAINGPIRGFLDIIKKADFSNLNYLTLIGDILGDRGNNDFLMLQLLKILKDKGVEIDYKKSGITFSNHDAWFISIFPLDPHDPASMAKIDQALDMFKGGQDSSLVNLLKSIKAGAISVEEVNELVKEVYLPSLKLFDYGFAEDGRPILNNHAPIGLGQINAFIDHYGLPIDHLTEENTKGTAGYKRIANAFDAINTAFQNQEANYDKLFSDKRTVKERVNEFEKNDPWKALIWNRFDGQNPDGSKNWNCVEGDLIRPSHIIFNAGHDSGERDAGCMPENVRCVDGGLGKPKGGGYTISGKPVKGKINKEGEYHVLLPDRIFRSPEAAKAYRNRKKIDPPGKDPKGKKRIPAAGIKGKGLHTGSEYKFDIDQIKDTCEDHDNLTFDEAKQEIAVQLAEKKVAKIEIQENAKGGNDLVTDSEEEACIQAMADILAAQPDVKCVNITHDDPDRAKAIKVMKIAASELLKNDKPFKITDRPDIKVEDLGLDSAQMEKLNDLNAALAARPAVGR